MSKPRLLNGCAKSKFIADAFEAKGWEAWTCDILPAEGPGNHIQDDVLKHLNDGWDMAIFHPDCKYLSRAGIYLLIYNPIRHTNMLAACEFFNCLLHAPIPRLAVENPIQHRFARELIRKPDQAIDPYMFGDHERKRTHLWLVNLPFLNPTEALWAYEKPIIEQSGKRRYFTDRGNSHSSYRARNFPGIANAMANQWGSL